MSDYERLIELATETDIPCTAEKTHGDRGQSNNPVRPRTFLLY